MQQTDRLPPRKRRLTAIDLARLLDTELIVVSVWDIAYPGYGAMGFAPISTNADLAKLGEEEASRISVDAAARAEEAGVETRTVALRGFPVEAICEAAEKFAPQFLVIGSHGWGAMKRAVFGSVSTGVLHHASCPVLVVRGVPERAVAAANGAHESAKV